MTTTFTGKLTQNATLRKTDNLTTNSVVQIALGMNAGRPRKARSSQVAGLVLTLALVLAPGYLLGQVTPAGCPPGSVQPPPGLVAWWPLDEGSDAAVSDHSGLGNHGTASGSIGSSSNPKSVTGFVGNGLNFFFGSHVSVPTSPSLNFGPPAVSQNTSFTIDAWIKGQPSPIVSNFNLQNKFGYTVTFDGNNVLRFEMGTGATPSMAWLGPPITREAWTFIAVVVDRTSKKVTLYTAPAGSNLATSSPLPSIPTSANAYSGLPLAIGGCPGNPNGCDTILDEVEIFNRALTQAELQTITPVQISFLRSVPGG